MRVYGSLTNKLITVLLCVAPIIAVLYILDVPIRLGIFIYEVSYLSLFSALILIAVFIIIPASRNSRKGSLPWYDGLLIVATIIPCSYLFLYYEEVISHGVYAFPYEQALGIILIIAIVEATRRTTSWIVVIIMLIFGAYSLVCNYFPVGNLLYGPKFSFARVIGYYYLYDDGIFGIIISVMCTVVVFYILFGQVLQNVGATDKLMRLAIALTGRYRGGPAKTAVVASAGLGMFTGSIPANIATTGIVTIPLMKKMGYTPEYAGAVEAVASTGGSITPPVMAAVAFLIAEFLDLPYSTIVISAIIPALLYYVGCYFQLDGRSVRLKMKGLTPREVPPLKSSLRATWVLLIPLAVLVFLLIGLNYRAALAAMYATLAVLLISMFQKESRISLAKLAQAFSGTSRLLMNIVPIVLAAGLITSAVGLTGLGVRMSQLLIEISNGNLIILVIISWITVFIMGMGLPATACYIIPAILIAPAMVELDVHPIAAHFCLYYMSRVGFLTPPVCVGAYVAAGIAGARPFATGFEAMRLAFVIYAMPFLLIFKSSILALGAIHEIALAVATCGLGIIAIAEALEGTFGNTDLNGVQRVLLGAGGVALMLGTNLLLWIVGTLLIIIALVLLVIK
ncbi:TRAP transporter permease, partial [Chloroflexota bacterium]